MSAPGHRRKTTPQANWRTPKDLFRAANREFRFTLDGAADQTNHLVDRFLSATPGGQGNFGNAWQFAKNPDVTDEWLAEERIFLNPTYGTALPRWARWCRDISARGATVFAVLPVSTAAWFRTIWETADEVRITTRRPQFIHPPQCECKACEAGEAGSSTMDIWFVVWRPRYVTDGWAVRGPHFSMWEYPRDEA